MSLATIKVGEGVFTHDEKRRMIEKVTEAMVAVEGERPREKTTVIIEEVKGGDWEIGGVPLTSEDVARPRAGGRPETVGAPSPGRAVPRPRRHPREPRRRRLSSWRSCS